MLKDHTGLETNKVKCKLAFLGELFLRMQVFKQWKQTPYQQVISLMCPFYNLLIYLFHILFMHIRYKTLE